MALLRQRFIRWLGLCAVGAAALAQLAPTTRAADVHATPLELRAVFLLNLARFVRWPEHSLGDAKAPFVIGYYGNDPISLPLEQIVHDESIDGHPIELRQLRRGADLSGCHVVFFSPAHAADQAPAIRAQRNRPILLVGDGEGFLALGGHIQFYQLGNQLRLRVNSDSLRESQLVPNSQLMRVATVQ